MPDFLGPAVNCVKNRWSAALLFNPRSSYPDDFAATAREMVLPSHVFLHPEKRFDDRMLSQS